MPIQDDDVIHGSWQRLYRAGAWSTLAYVVLVLVPVVLVFAAPVPPTSGAALLEYIGAHGWSTSSSWPASWASPCRHWWCSPRPTAPQVRTSERDWPTRPTP